jgi:hypothetical protein
MIVNKHVEGGFIEVLYESSNVLASKYDQTNKKLAVIYGSGQQYLYHNVTLEDYNKFESADSQGSAIHKYIKKYKSEKSENIVDVLPIKEQIEFIKKENNK